MNDRIKTKEAGACLKNTFCQMYPEWYDNAPDTGVYLNPYLRNAQ